MHPDEGKGNVLIVMQEYNSLIQVSDRSCCKKELSTLWKIEIMNHAGVKR